MKFYYFLLLFISLVFGLKTFAQEKMTFEQKEIIRQNKLIKLIDQEARLIARVKTQNLRLRYRLFELYSEKLKVLKQIENKKFIEASLKNPQIKREVFFNRTLNLYNETQNLGQTMIKVYPNNPLLAEIYYTMALNSRDYGMDKKSLNYLKISLKHAHAKKQLQYYIHTALAEHYYNEKNYKSCIYHYNQTFYKKDDNWFTKNLYNYGWCEFKINAYTKAIDTLVKSYELSQDKNYIDMSDQVINSLITFHVFNKTPLEAMAFIKNKINKPYDYYMTLLTKASDKGFFDESQIIIKEMKDLIPKIDPKKQEEIYSRLNMFELNFYQQYKKDELFYNKVVELSNRAMPEDIREELIYFIKPVLGIKQKIITQEYVPGSNIYRENLLSEIVGYFSVLKKIDSKETAKYEYLLGETYYGLEIFDRAQTQYEKSWQLELKAKKTKEMKKSLDSWLAALAGRELSSHQKDLETIRVFKNYTEYFPKDEKTQKIFPRLFHLEFAKKGHEDAFKTLRRFSSFYPNENDQQKDLLRILINDSIDKKSPEILNIWLAHLQKGYLKFDIKEIQKVEETLAKLLFDRFEKLRVDKKYEEAIAGYQKIYFDNQYPKNIRAEAAFNMIFIFVDTDRTNDALKWLAKSFQNLPEKEKKQKKDILLKQIIRLTLKQDLWGGEKLALFSISHFCKDKDTINNEMIQNLASVYFAQNYLSKLFYNYPRMKICASNQFDWTQMDKNILVHLIRNKEFNLLQRFILPRKNDNEFMKFALNLSYQFLFTNFEDNSKRKFFMTLLSYSNSEQDKKLLADIENIKRLQDNMESFSSHPIVVEKKFDMEKFNTKLSTRIEELTQLSKDSSSILKGLDPHLILLVQNSQVVLLTKLAEEVRSYNPQGETKDFIAQFKGQMQALAANFDIEKNKIIKKSHVLIQKNELFFKDAPHLYATGNILSNTDYRTPASYLSLTTAPIQEVR